MKIDIFHVSILLLISAGLFSCQKHGISIDANRPVALPANGMEVVNANNQFAFHFFQAGLQQDPTNDNKLISPLSVYMALSMAYNGAGGTTRDSMVKTLQLGNIPPDLLNAVSKALIAALPAEDNQVQLSIANSLWYRQNSFTPLAAYLDTVKNYYSGKIQSLNFNDPGAVNTINDWVAQNTNNKIPSILSSISPTDMLFLINAIYFNGSWQHAFKKSDTHNDNFYLQNGNTISVPFMQQTEILRAYTDPAFTVAELPYGSGNSYALELILPNDRQQPIDEFIASFDESRLAGAIAGMDSQSVQLAIPKWEYAYNIDDMSPSLSALGMGIAFTGSADFSNLYDVSQIQVHISKAIHKTYIKVDEEGTEAAAVTSLGLSGSAIQISLPVKADHPFLYAILEKQTGSVLFLGIVNDPSKN